MVIVVPHSHCDPGWINTFEEYFELKVTNIFDNMVKHLAEKEDLKFIYAVMFVPKYKELLGKELFRKWAFLSAGGADWMRRLVNKLNSYNLSLSMSNFKCRKAKTLRFLERGQFEIVTGGWVMSDEANAHYYSMVMELFEGHEFLRNSLSRLASRIWYIFEFLNIFYLDYTPTNHWSIGKYFWQTIAPIDK